MDAQNQEFNQRWQKVEDAKRQTRKVAYALMAGVLTSLLMAVTSVMA